MPKKKKELFKTKSITRVNEEVYIDFKYIVEKTGRTISGEFNRFMAGVIKKYNAAHHK